MHRPPSWRISAWSGFICALLAFSLLFRGAVGASGALLLGALGLFAWALWLSHHDR